MDESTKKKVEYLDWYFTCDNGMADKDAQKAWFELRKQITNRIEPLNKKEIRNQFEYIREFLEEHQENWYVYETLRDELRQLEIMLEREKVI